MTFDPSVATLSINTLCIQPVAYVVILITQNGSLYHLVLPLEEQVEKGILPFRGYVFFPVPTL